MTLEFNTWNTAPNKTITYLNRQDVAPLKQTYLNTEDVEPVKQSCLTTHEVAVVKPSNLNTNSAPIKYKILPEYIGCCTTDTDPLERTLCYTTETIALQYPG